ncbi:hypothetical protein B5F76_07690 [Desulfovibrio sp. An276]|nr:hypothetical protein B5F76_07690 [Desulfovibrio sp. An276]
MPAHPFVYDLLPTLTSFVKDIHYTNTGELNISFTVASAIWARLAIYAAFSVAHRAAKPENSGGDFFS